MILKHEASHCMSWPVKVGVLVVALVVLPATAELVNQNVEVTAEADAEWATVDVVTSPESELSMIVEIAPPAEPEVVVHTKPTVDVVTRPEPVLNTIVEIAPPVEPEGFVRTTPVVYPSNAAPQRGRGSNRGLEDRISRLEKLVQELVAATKAQSSPPLPTRLNRSNAPVQDIRPPREGRLLTPPTQADPPRVITRRAPVRIRSTRQSRSSRPRQNTLRTFEGDVADSRTYETERVRPRETDGVLAEVRAEVEALRQRVHELQKENTELKARLRDRPQPRTPGDPAR